MSEIPASLGLKTLRIALVIAPWVLAMYTFWWLDNSGTWTPETPHRGKLSVALLASGMLATFLLQSFFWRSKK